jgi:hypothetical protein
LIDDMTTLDGWGNFYVIAGSAAGARIGLQFAVMTLIANMPITRSNAHAGDAFTTPAVVHFGVALLLSASRFFGALWASVAWCTSSW